LTNTTVSRTIPTESVNN